MRAPTTKSAWVRRGDFCGDCFGTLSGREAIRATLDSAGNASSVGTGVGSGGAAMSTSSGKFSSMASAHVRQPNVLNDDNFSGQSQSQPVHTQVLFRLSTRRRLLGETSGRPSAGLESRETPEW